MSTDLNRENFTLIAIALAGGDPLTPVQLQKSLFLFGKLLPADQLPKEFYTFTPYNYGPFASPVYIDAQTLQDAGLVEIAKPAGRSYASYSATEAGLQEAGQLLNRLPANVQAQAQRVIDWIKAQSFSGLVSAIYEKYPEFKVNSIFR